MRCTETKTCGVPTPRNSNRSVGKGGNLALNICPSMVVRGTYTINIFSLPSPTFPNPNACFVPCSLTGSLQRICLGQQFALTEAGYVTVRFLQRFDQIDGAAMDGLPPAWFLTLTGRPKHGVKLRMHAANED